jgi:hypothetical protein
MELDEKTRRKIEQLAGKSVVTYGRVSSLLEISPDGLEVAVQLATLHGGSILAIQYLRHLTQCTLAEAIDFLNNVQLANRN